MKQSRRLVMQSSSNSPKNSPKTDRINNASPKLSRPHANDDIAGSSNPNRLFSSTPEQLLKLIPELGLTGPIIIAEDTYGCAKTIFQLLYNFLKEYKMKVTPASETKYVDLKQLSQVSQAFLNGDHSPIDIIWAKNGNEILKAIRLLKARDIKPILCIFDDVMPEKKGSDAVKELNAEGFEGIIYMCSSSLDPSSELVVEGYLQKPVKKDEIESLLKTVIERQIEENIEAKRMAISNRKRSW